MVAKGRQALRQNRPVEMVAKVRNGPTISVCIAQVEIALPPINPCLQFPHKFVGELRLDADFQPRKDTAVFLKRIDTKKLLSNCFLTGGRLNIQLSGERGSPKGQFSMNRSRPFYISVLGYESTPWKKGSCLKYRSISRPQGVGPSPVAAFNQVREDFTRTAFVVNGLTRGTESPQFFLWRTICRQHQQGDLTFLYAFNHSG